ncbi:MAG: RnfABCDGE type electron transport complex subunit D [Deltaproteobacteria bacterium]|nr:RnfABCDGE type electron transport complex subunit D [Deltaproteobacteria bacterium]MBN2670908.1 RnfABCDGE type electron transport complex subunit D [Deltaproteobacteria bacterium]
MTKQLIVSSSPHAHSGKTTASIMWTVLAALVPAAAYSVYLFGLPALTVLLATTVFCVIFEGLSNFMMGKPVTLKDGSAALTGIILALTLPPGLPLWICGVGAFVSIVVAKSVFGGLGQNPFNPAMTGRVFLLIAFPAPLTKWLVPTGTGEMLFNKPVSAFDAAGNLVSAGAANVDAITAATPLGLLSEEGAKAVMGMDTSTEFLIGQINGSLGETSGILLLAGGIFLLTRKIISWHIPVSFMAAVAAIAAITHAVNPEHYAGALFHLLTGGVFLGAWFMATDYVTSPMFTRGKLIFGAGCGVLTMVIRLWAGYPEGVSFAVLLMNACVPIINMYTKPKKFGLQDLAAKKEAANA